MSFQTAVEFVRRTDTGIKPSQADQLEFYALYKQATEGDCIGSKPGLLDLSGRAKFDAWSGKKGMSKEDAQVKYIEALMKVCPNWEAK